jgi:hypothetical protein
MKKILLLAVLLLTVNSFAQSSATIKIGEFVPSTGGGGLIVGYQGDRLFDEFFSLGWSVDWFHSSYTDKKAVQDFNNWYGFSGTETNELRAESSVNDFPIMGAITFTTPVAPFYRVYFTGALGAEMLIISYNNFQNPEQSDTKAAFDLNWRIAAGGIYEIGRRSDLFLELGYHSSAPSWDYEVDNPNGIGKKMYQRTFDMSGFMIRAGVKFYY